MVAMYQVIRHSDDNIFNEQKQMTVEELTNIFLRLDMAGKAEDSEFLFGSSEDGVEPFSITGVVLDEDGDVCLESDDRKEYGLSATELAAAVSVYDGNKTIYFVHIDREGESTLFNIKDGGTKDRNSESLRKITAGRVIEVLGKYAHEAILHFESGTINFTVNSIYEDAQGCVCLESNEIMELDDYPVGLLVEEISHWAEGTGIYFYDDDSREYYEIYPDEIRTDEKGDVWIKIR